MYLNPLKPSKVQNSDPVVKETSRLLGQDAGVSAAPVKKLEWGSTVFRLDKEQQEEYNRRLGTLRSSEWGKLIKSPEYKALDDTQKQKALRNLSEDVSAVVKREFAANNTVGPYAPGYTGKDTKLTAKQRAIVTGESNVARYTRSTSSSTGTDPTPAEKYKDALSKYEQDKSSMSTVQRYAKEGELAKLKVQKDYSSDVLKLYGMSKADAYKYLTTKEKNVDKKKLAEQLKAYDNALYEAGLSKYRKYRNGLAPASGRSGGRNSGGRKAKRPPV
jgi:hypothetical protein